MLLLLLLPLDIRSLNPCLVAHQAPRSQLVNKERMYILYTVINGIRVMVALLISINGGIGLVYALAKGPGDLAMPPPTQPGAHQPFGATQKRRRGLRFRGGLWRRERQ